MSVHTLALERNQLSSPRAPSSRQRLVEPWSALTYAASQQKQEAHHWIRQALAQAQSEGFLRLFLEEGEPVARLLVTRFQEKEIRSYARTLLRAFAQTVGEGFVDPTSSHDLIVKPLSPQEQRVFKLVMAGHSNSQIAQE